MGFHSVNREALVGEVAGHVKMLAFRTDKPVHEVRLIIDGKEVASDKFGDSKKGVKVAVVTPVGGGHGVEIFGEI